MKDATQFHIRPARPEEAGLFYTPHPEEDKRLGTVGHVRMDFGRSGNEFWHTWWPRGPEELNSPAFKAELQQIVGKLREDVLKNRFAMERFCYDHGGKIDGGYVQNYPLTNIATTSPQVSTPPVPCGGAERSCPSCSSGSMRTMCWGG